MPEAEADELPGGTAAGVAARRRVEPLPWDTEFFGVRIGRADMRRMAFEDVVADARKLGLECVYLSFPAHDLRGIEGAVRRGARLVELRLRLFARWDVIGARADPRVRVAEASDRPGLLGVAHRGSRLSRFARDPRFEEARVRELYERTLDRCLTEGVIILSALGGQSVFAVYTDGKTAEVPLVEVDPRERHLGLSVHMARLAAHVLYVPRVFVTIEASRTAALRLAQEMGFRHRSAAALVHLWLDELGGG